MSFLADTEAQREVVVFLSYKGNVPQEEFLAIWPGRYQGKSLDFVFTCKRDSTGLDSERIHPVLRLDQDLADIGLSTAPGSADEESLDKKEYRAFHNFFHAVRIWRGRRASSMR
jgi:hypothetical protein